MKSRDERLKEARARWAEDARKRDTLRSRLEVEHGLVGHPKAGKLFDLAWEDGHASGEHEVEQQYDRLADLLKEDPQ